jgi:hypothetical protein
MKVNDRNIAVVGVEGSFQFILKELKRDVGCGCFGNNYQNGV